MKVRLYLRVRLPNGNRQCVDPVYAANGKLKPLCAFVDGKQEHHREGVYHLRYLKAGKRVWENGYCESFNCKLRDQFLNGEIFYSPKEVPVLAEGWRVYYNTRRPHSSLGYRPTAPAAWQAETTMGLGKEESKEHFPPSLTPDYGGGLTNSPTDRPRVFLTTANVRACFINRFGLRSCTYV